MIVKMKAKIWDSVSKKVRDETYIAAGENLDEIISAMEGYFGDDLCAFAVNFLPDVDNNFVNIEDFNDDEGGF